MKKKTQKELMVWYLIVPGTGILGPMIYRKAVAMKSMMSLVTRESGEKLTIVHKSVRQVLRAGSRLAASKFH
jgi:hypothetical protein